VLLSRFVSQTLRTFINSENHEDLIVLTGLIESQQVAPVIDRRYPLAEAPKAIRYLLEGHARGKVVITI
jgi:NADPH:quinone reductase-like Zn-dependent oxidoreductase